jgi:hypothetical protein
MTVGGHGRRSFNIIKFKQIQKENKEDCMDKIGLWVEHWTAYNTAIFTEVSFDLHQVSYTACKSRIYICQLWKKIILSSRIKCSSAVYSPISSLSVRGKCQKTCIYFYLFIYLYRYANVHSSMLKSYKHVFLCSHNWSSGVLHRVLPRRFGENRTQNNTDASSEQMSKRVLNGQRRCVITSARIYG